MVLLGKLRQVFCRATDRKEEGVFSWMTNVRNRVTSCRVSLGETPKHVSPPRGSPAVKTYGAIGGSVDVKNFVTN